MMITSACLGEALATSNPNLEKSYLAEAVAIISMPQQLVANVSGHKEFDLAQLMTSSSLLSTMPPPGNSCTWPGKDWPFETGCCMGNRCDAPAALHFGSHPLQCTFPVRIEESEEQYKKENNDLNQSEPTGNLSRYGPGI